MTDKIDRSNQPSSGEPQTTASVPAADSQLTQLVIDAKAVLPFLSSLGNTDEIRATEFRQILQGSFGSVLATVPQAVWTFLDNVHSFGFDQYKRELEAAGLSASDLAAIKTASVVWNEMAWRETGVAAKVKNLELMFNRVQNMIVVPIIDPGRKYNLLHVRFTDSEGNVVFESCDMVQEFTKLASGLVKGVQKFYQAAKDGHYFDPVQYGSAEEETLRSIETRIAALRNLLGITAQGPVRSAS